MKDSEMILADRVNNFVVIHKLEENEKIGNC